MSSFFRKGRDKTKCPANEEGFAGFSEVLQGSIQDVSKCKNTALIFFNLAHRTGVGEDQEVPIHSSDEEPSDNEVSAAVGADNSQQSSEVYPDSPKSGAQHQVRFLLLMTLVCLHSLLIIDTR